MKKLSLNTMWQEANANGKFRSPLALRKGFALPDPGKSPLEEFAKAREQQVAAILDVKEAMKTASDMEKRATVIPETKVYEHQQNAVRKFFDNQGNIIVAHGVGSGKTLTGMHIFEEARKQGQAKKALVVVPASLRNNFLENGIHKFTTSSGTIYGNKAEVSKGSHASLLKPTNSDYHIVSAEMFRKEPETWIKNTKADTVIYDEIHRAKDDAGLTYKAIKKVRPLHRNFIGLTGSFISNNPSDIVPIVDAMTNGKHELGTKAQFERRHLIEDDKGNKKFKDVGGLSKVIGRYIDYFGTDQMKASDMPEKKVEEIHVEMSPQQHQLFNFAIGKLDPNVLNKLKQDIDSLSEREIGHIFSKILHARKVSNSLHTLDDRISLEDSAEKTPKVKRLLSDVDQHLRETPDAQVIIYTNLIHGGVDVLRAGLKKRGIEHGVFMGKKQGVSEDTRQKDVEDFKQGKKKVLVISSAGAEGLNLPNTTLFASLDGHFNPEKILQAEARGVRAGGLSHRPVEDRKVLVRRYLTVSPRGSETTMGGLWNMLSSWFFTAPKKSKDVLDVPSVDEWIYGIAKRKDHLNNELRRELRKTGAHLALPAKSLREEYWDKFHHLTGGKKPDATQVSPEEKEFLQRVRNSARARLLTPHLMELLREALAMHKVDPKLLLILALVHKKQFDLHGIEPHEAYKMLSMSDTKLRKLVRGDLKQLPPLKLTKLDINMNNMTGITSEEFDPSGSEEDV